MSRSEVIRFFLARLSVNVSIALVTTGVDLIEEVQRRTRVAPSEPRVVYAQMLDEAIDKALRRQLETDPDYARFIRDGGCGEADCPSCTRAKQIIAPAN